MPVIKVENDASLYGTASAVFMNCDRSFRDFQKVFEALEGKYDHDSLDSIRSSWNRMWDKMRDEVDKLVHIRKAYESERQELEKRTAAHEKELEDVKGTFAVQSC